MRLSFLLIFLCFPRLGGMAVAEESVPWERLEETRGQMGTQFKIIVWTDKATSAKASIEAAFQRIAALNSIMSDYDAQSEVSRLSKTSGKGESIRVSDDLWRVLAVGRQLSEQSGGAFEMTVGPLMHLWRVSRRTSRLPSVEKLETAMASTGFQMLLLDPEKRSVSLTRSGMLLDLGGIAKGDAVDQALEVLRKTPAIRAALVDGGGDLRVFGAPPDQRGWTVGLKNLGEEAGQKEMLILKDRAVATSGDLFNSIILEGREFSHIIDPKTGLGLEWRRTVTVLAADCITADALASALSVLPVGDSRALLAEHYPQAAAEIITNVDGILERVKLADYPGPEKDGDPH